MSYRRKQKDRALGKAPVYKVETTDTTHMGAEVAVMTLAEAEAWGLVYDPPTILVASPFWGQIRQEVRVNVEGSKLVIAQVPILRGSKTHQRRWKTFPGCRKSYYERDWDIIHPAYRREIRQGDGIEPRQKGTYKRPSKGMTLWAAIQEEVE